MVRPLEEGGETGGSKIGIWGTLVCLLLVQHSGIVPQGSGFPFLASRALTYT
jgi:hypothetical protein